MTIANILVPLSGAPHDAIALATALAAARPFHAHVSALFVSPVERDSMAISDWQISPEVVQQIAEARVRTTNQSKENARGTFAAGVLQARAKVAPMAQRSDGVTASWREGTGRLSQAIAANALFADLVVFPPPAGARDAELHDAFLHTLLKTGRPVLLSPQATPETVGSKVAVGWDDGLAASHAVVAALPFLEACGKVELLCVRKASAPEFKPADVREYLALHRVTTTERLLARSARPVGETLLDAAAGCDLIVVGGYGHSRAFESVFGGVTEHIASHARIPILMVH